MRLSPSRSLDRPTASATIRRLRDAAETMARLSNPAPEVISPVLPETRRLFDRLLAAESLDLVVAPDTRDAMRVLSYRVRPEAAAHVRFCVAEAQQDLLRFLGRASLGFEILEVRQAGLQFHWRSDLLRAFDEQAPILGAFCAFAPRGELVLEHLAVPVIRRHRVREIRGWIVLGRDLTDDLCGPDALSMTRRPLRSRLVGLPRRLMHPHGVPWPMSETMSDLQTRWTRRNPLRGKP